MRRYWNRNGVEVTVLETEQEVREDHARIINMARRNLLMEPLTANQIFTKKGKFRKNLFVRKETK